MVKPAISHRRRSRRREVNHGEPGSARYKRKRIHFHTGSTGSTARWSETAQLLSEADMLNPGVVVTGGPISRATNSFKHDTSGDVPPGLREAGLAPWSVGDGRAMLVRIGDAYIDLPSPEDFYALEGGDPGNPLHIGLVKQEGSLANFLFQHTRHNGRPFLEIVTGLRGKKHFLHPTEQINVKVNGYRMGEQRIAAHSVQCAPDNRVCLSHYGRSRQYPIELKQASKMTGDNITARQTFLYSWALQHMENVENNATVEPVLIILEEEYGAGRFYRFSQATRRGPTAMNLLAAGRFALRT